MNPERRDVLVRFVLDGWALPRARRIRTWSGIGLVLCGVVAGILISVKLDGATGADDVVVPAVIAAGLGLVCLVGFVYGVVEVRAGKRHELIVALREEPPRIEQVSPMMINGVWPALELRVSGGGSHIVPMDQATQQELIDWLAPGRSG